jgi:thioredoxin-related protein
VSSVANEWKTGRVLRLNTASQANREYADRVGVTDTPTFILFDREGKELRRWVRDAPTLADLP